MADSKLVSVAKPKITGGALMGALGSPLPTDATTAVDAAIKAVGYVGEGGVTNQSNRNSEKFRAWGGAIVHVAQTEFGETYSLTLLESANADVLKAIYGAENVTITGTAPATKIAIKHNELETPAAVWVFDMVTGSRKRRIAVPVGKISNVGDVKYSDKDLIAYEIELDALPDASGNASYEYIDA